MIERARWRRVDRRLLLAAAGLGGVLLGLLLLMTVFRGEGDQDVTGVAATPAPTTTITEASVPETRAGIAGASATPAPRDPFVPIVTVPEGTGSAQGSGQAPSPSPQPSPSPGGAAPTPAPAAGASSASLELKSIAPDGGGVPRAEIVVDGRSHSPAEGEVFSYGYRLERIDGRCVEVSAQAARARMCLPAAAP